MISHVPTYFRIVRLQIEETEAYFHVPLNFTFSISFCDDLIFFILLLFIIIIIIILP